MKIKEKLINALGGYTKEQHFNEVCKAMSSALHDSYSKIKQYAKSLNGLDAGEWTVKMYEFIERAADANINIEIEVSDDVEEPMVMCKVNVEDKE